MSEGMLANAPAPLPDVMPPVHPALSEHAALPEDAVLQDDAVLSDVPVSPDESALPSVVVITKPRVSIEVLAIAVGVFAVVQSLVAFAPELVWVGLCFLAANRRELLARRRDLVFAQARRRAQLSGDCCANKKPARLAMWCSHAAISRS